MQSEFTDNMNDSNENDIARGKENPAVGQSLPSQRLPMQYLGRQMPECREPNLYQRSDTVFRAQSYSSYVLCGSMSLPLSSTPLRYSYTVNVTACPGATRITRGVMPL
jgi:hypothetical protein